MYVQPATLPTARRGEVHFVADRQTHGAPQGFLPLRQQLQRKLAELEIAAAPEQIVTTVGVTQALDLVARAFTRPGDTIFVDDPAWFLMFGSFAALGAKVVGIPRLADGPDLVRLAQLAALHKPKLYVINSVLHNPTSTSLSAAKAFQVLRLAEEHDFTIAEDDIYCDLHPGSAMQPATRLAALDQLQRVIYLGGFSKSMAANLRVGLTVDVVPPAGMFVWVDTGLDTNVLAERALAEGLLLAPGCLFSPSQLPSSRVRLNVAAMQDPLIWQFLEREMGARQPLKSLF